MQETVIDMEDKKVNNYIQKALENMPSDWLRLTTHRLDIYNEELAKTEFLEHFEALITKNQLTREALEELPTAYDYIRLGHPLSCLLEWAIAKSNNIEVKSIISFASETIPLLAILRKNALDGKDTRIHYVGELPQAFDVAVIKEVYGYQFELNPVDSAAEVEAFGGSNVFINHFSNISPFDQNQNIDFHLHLYAPLGSVLYIQGKHNEPYIADIQHVRRRESIAMTPADAYEALQTIIAQAPIEERPKTEDANKAAVLRFISNLTTLKTKALVGSSGLSIQYAILMGLVDDALEKHPGKAIKIVVPPNCYGGTNDQARRVAASIECVEVLDLAVDGDSDMARSAEAVLTKVAAEDAVPFIIAEIPTNPRVEVPNLIELKKALTKTRRTPSGELAVAPVFILDQTFCPNVQFMAEGDTLTEVRTISFSSGSKFASGGLCNAGYCIGNEHVVDLMAKVEKHLLLCDNEATPLQYELMAKYMPSMLDRITAAYQNTRAFVSFIEEALPEAKINFVSEELAAVGFTPSVFSLRLPTQGNTEEEKEQYRRALNLRLINMMITKIPHESKNCVSYGQLKGVYWTVPATSTQGTTKEGDKDYIVRVALSPEVDLELHQQVFLEFVATL